LQGKKFLFLFFIRSDLLFLRFTMSEEDYVFDSDEDEGVVFDSDEDEEEYDSRSESNSSESDSDSEDEGGGNISLDALAAGSQPPAAPPLAKSFSLDDSTDIMPVTEHRDPRKCSVDLGGRRPSQVLAALKSDVALTRRPSWKEKAGASSRRRSNSSASTGSSSAAAAAAATAAANYSASQSLGSSWANNVPYIPGSTSTPDTSGRKGSWRDTAAASIRRKTGQMDAEAAGDTGLGINKDQLAQLQQQHRSTVIQKVKHRVKLPASRKKSASGKNELGAAMERRRSIASGLLAPKKPFNPYQFDEFSRSEARNLVATFKKYDKTASSSLDLMELKYMMEKLGHPQTHIGLKSMIKEVGGADATDLDMRAFFEIFRRAKNGTLQHEGLRSLADAFSVDVSEVGVGGAKAFFEAKAAKLTQVSSFEQEIKAEQEEKREEAAKAKERREAFKSMREKFK
jgi:hypothetical protein